MAGKSGVDDRDALRDVDQVRGDDVVADAVQVGTELHDASLSMAMIRSYDGLRQ
jgi:hypothetical protein